MTHPRKTSDDVGRPIEEGSSQHTEAGEFAPPAIDAVDHVIGLVTRTHVPGALNIYDEEECQAHGDRPGEATARRVSLHRYLVDHWAAPTVLVGEAPGKNGARLSGVPFTSLRQLTGSGPAEPSATIVHRVLSDLRIEQDTLLWNVSFLCPPDNRDPRRAEVEACAEVRSLICRGRVTLAVGRHAQRATGAPCVRHPSHGGASLFAEGLRFAYRSPPGVDVRSALDQLIGSGPDRRESRGPGPTKAEAARAVCPECFSMVPTSGICGACAGWPGSAVRPHHRYR
jgi:hypothetical protein